MAPEIVVGDVTSDTTATLVPPDNERRPRRPADVDGERATRMERTTRRRFGGVRGLARNVDQTVAALLT
jgi:hypothetical protein